MKRDTLRWVNRVTLEVGEALKVDEEGHTEVGEEGPTKGGGRGSHYR